ncbi:hypothetical protein LTR22_010072, partial [Elasticomyces elasticus]
MSGGEVALVFGLISSAITVIETCKEVYDAAHDTQGLPEAFRKVSENIPLVLDILQAAEKVQWEAKERYREAKDTKAKQEIEENSKAVKPAFEGCKADAEALQTIFNKVLPGDAASFMQRYTSAARAAKPGRKQKVEDLMKDILAKLQLLDSRESFKTAASVAKIKDAITALNGLSPSLPDDDSVTYNNYGSGPQHLEGDIHGGYYSQGDHATMNFAHTYHTHMLPDRPETPPQPSSNVPFRRDPHFVERAPLADQIRAKLSEPAGRAALVGLGGVGKSQLAIEYARQLRQRSPQTWVLWLHASNAARFEQSVRDVADQLKLYGRKDPKANLLQLLRNWLRDEGKGDWLVVLDNADDVGFLLQRPAVSGEAQATQRRVDYVPTCDHGSVIITTRSKREALRLVYESEMIDVLPMSEDEAEALLESKLGQSSHDNLELVLALDRIPLAISQAAAYIRERTPRCSVQQYREEIEQSRALRTSLLRRDVPLPSRDAEASSSVLLTWQISFEHLYDTRRSAAELLSLMSFCDRLAIPEILLRVEVDDTNEGSDSTLGFEEDVVALRSFSFVSRTASAQEWEMHRLVQDATLVWLEGHGRLNEIRERFVHHLYMSFPTGNFENWSLCRTLFPHAKSASEQRPVSANALLEWASVMYRSAWYAAGQGDSIDALEMATCSMTARSEQLGEEDQQTLWSEAIVASTLRGRGQWKEAEELQVKVMETSVRVLGGEHPDTLSSMANLASTYRNQGRWKEAEEMQVKVMETRARVLGGEHPDTLSSMANLASTYWKQGRWKEAEELQLQIMEAREKKLAKEHPDTLTAKADLAATYRKQGRWKEAEELLLQVVEAREKKLGK